MALFVVFLDFFLTVHRIGQPYELFNKVVFGLPVSSISQFAKLCLNFIAVKKNLVRQIPLENELKLK